MIQPQPAARPQPGPRGLLPGCGVKPRPANDLRSPRRGWAVLVPALVLLAASALPAQQPKPGSPAPGPAADAAPDAPAEPGADQGTVDTKAAPKRAGLEERYKDPRADAAMANTFPELFTRVRAANAGDDRQIRAMAAGQIPSDKTVINTYVQAQIAQLTRRQNIDAMLNASSDSRPARAIEEAGQNLLQPLLQANEANNARFRTDFTSALVSVANDVLKNHLYARLMLMMALSRSEDPQAIPVFVQQLDNPDQVLTVKLLAAVGLTNLTQQGKQNLEPARAIQAAKALAGFLDREKDAFWPAQFRAVEAIGSLRQAESVVRSPTSDIAATLLGIVADPKQREQVRAEAAWALGMLRPSSASRFNFELAAYHMASAAADIAEKITQVQPDSNAQAARLADLLVQLYLGFEGDAALRAGLLRSEHPNLSTQRTKVQALANQVKALATAAVDLTRAAKAQQPDKLKDLDALVSQLRDYLANNPPADLALYANGPSFPVEREEAEAGPGS
jgi:hypothetical protein